MDSIKSKLPAMPSMKLPKLKKLREWNAETITTNLSQFVNRYRPKQSETSEAPPSLPPQHVQSPRISGISTISGGVVEVSSRTRDKSKDNHGLYALKHDRNAAKRGLLLSIPLKKHKRSGSTAKEMIHEKFQSCEKLDTDSEGSINDCEEEVLRIEVEEPPAAPPRRRRSQDKGRAPAVPILPNIPKNPSELYRIKNAAVKPNSVDIFKKEEDVFREFDQIFKREPIPKLKPHLSSSFSSSIEESYEEVKQKAIGRKNSTIKVQEFNAVFPRCRSIVSPKHPPPPQPHPLTSSESSSFEVIQRMPKPKPPTSILKKPPPVIVVPATSTKPKEIMTIAAKIEGEKHQTKPMLKVSPKPTKRFFVYYNDEDELVFNRNYSDVDDLVRKKNVSLVNNNDKFLLHQQQQQQQQPTNFTHFNHVDALFKHYYNTEHDSLRSAISTEGIFI